MTPTLLWFRRDLRLQDHAALTAALSRGGPVIAVFICDAQVETLGSAPKWRLGAGVAALQTALAAQRQPPDFTARGADRCDPPAGRGNGRDGGLLAACL